MGKTIAIIGALAVVTGLGVPTASAWDGARNWYDPADGQSPGGGGIFGTGSKRDYNITCADCHIDRADGSIELTFAFNPPLEQVSGEQFYVPGRRYTIDVTMVGETLTGPCGQYMAHTNNFAANFEDQAGEPAGVLESDAGQSQSNCPSAYPDPQTGTTVLYNDCEVILANGSEDQTQWRFYWTAPASGSGALTMFYGGVDGNCEMNSMGDLVVNGSRPMYEASAAKESPARWRFAVGSLALLPLLGVVVLARRRNRSAAEGCPEDVR